MKRRQLMIGLSFIGSLPLLALFQNATPMNRFVEEPEIRENLQLRQQQLQLKIQTILKLKNASSSLDIALSDLDGVVDMAKALKIKISAKSQAEIKQIKADVSDLKSKISSLLTPLEGNLSIQIDQNKIKEVLSRTDQLNAQTDGYHNKLKSRAPYLTKLIEGMKYNVSTKISDLLGCRVAGKASDTRSTDKQYFCHEFPVGHTNQGLIYRSYIADYEKFNNQLNERLVRERKVPEREWGTRYMMTIPLAKRCQMMVNQQNCIETQTRGGRKVQSCSNNPYYQADTNKRCIDTKLKLSDSQFEVAFTNEYDDWKINKSYFVFPIEYKDKKKIRHYDIDLKGLRANNSNFKLYNEAVSFSTKSTGYAKACFQVPGLKFHSFQQEFKYTYLDTPFGSLSQDIDFKAPTISFDRANVCGLFKLDLNNPEKPTYSVISLTAPRLENLQLTPMKIKLDGGLGGFLGNLLKVISGGLINVDKIASQYANKEAKKMSEDIASGKFFANYMADSLSNNFSSVVTTDDKKFNSAVNQNMQNGEKFQLDSSSFQNALKSYLQKNYIQADL